ncbi:MAG: TonB family protein [Terriglobales bacterium]
MRYPSSVQTRVSGPEWPEPDASEAEAESSGVLAFHSQEDSPSDFALDLRLHEILQQARLTTTASGAVIALARGNRMVCRATLGDKAPGVGVCLNTRSGLSGACVQTREMQLCDDTLVDPRVNATACSDLGIRSIAVQPVLDGEELWGVLEVLSLVPHAFSDSDLQELQGLSRKVLRTLQEATEGGSAPSAEEEVARALATDGTQPEVVEAEKSFEPVQQDVAMVRRDYRTGALTVAVIALAVLLGWMVGRVGWSMAVNRAPAQAPITPEEAQAMMPVIPETPSATTRRGEPPVSAKTASTSPRAPAKPVAKPKTETAEPTGGLVVYEHGKVVFRMAPSESEPPASTAAMESGAIQKAATREEDDPSVAPAAASPASANSYLLERVEPQYPEAARQQRIQGPVVLKVLVGTDGLVRKVSPISGDPQLVTAATDAVRQWRFKAHQLKGKVVEFETRVTVNFALP